jgi:uncharacterized protein (TIGR01244 family)
MELETLVPNLRHPRASLYTGGQPAPEAWRPLAEAGVGTVVNLRPASEQADRDEGGEVRAAGMTYVGLPIAGAESLGPDAAAALWRVLGEAHGDVLLHCGSGNRCGALLALAEAWHGGSSPAQALSLGRQAGLSGLEPDVRRLLG